MCERDRGEGEREIGLGLSLPPCVRAGVVVVDDVIVIDGAWTLSTVFACTSPSPLVWVESTFRSKYINITLSVNSLSP